MSDLKKCFGNNIYCILKNDAKENLKLYLTEDNAAIKMKDTEYSEEILKALILCYSQDEINVSSKVEKDIAAALNKEELEEFSQRLFNAWVLDNCDVNRKWIIKFSSRYGGKNIIKEIFQQIKIWIEEKNISKAIDGIMALSLNDSIDAFRYIEMIWRISNDKNIEKVAEDAIEFAIDRLNIDRERILDKIIPSLGLNTAGIAKIESDKKEYYIYLIDLFKFKIFDNNDKRCNNIVSRNKEIKKSLRELKNQLKKVTYKEFIRLEEYISNNRRWGEKEWIETFIENPIMRIIGSKFVWGIYSKNKIIRMIKYDFDILNRNVSINTLEYKNNAVLKNSDISYDLDENKEVDISSITEEINNIIFKDKYDEYEISLIHPTDMSEKYISIWKNLFEKLNLLQPVDQLYRQIFKVSEENHNKVYIDKFLGKIISSKILSTKMNKYGWYKGKFLEDGTYYGFYKENFKLKIAAELSIQGISISKENEDTKIYLLKFYRISENKKEKIKFDDVNKEDILKVYEVPRRFFSEVMYEVNNSLLESIRTEYTNREDINLYL